MRIVLLKDVPGLGRKNEVKSVSDGYALNMLIPKKLAVMGTPAAIARAERLKAEAETERKIQADLLSKNLSSLEGLSIEMAEKANEQGHLFSGIHKEKIAAELKRQKGIEVPPEFIELAHPIKETGEHAVAVQTLGRSVSFRLVVAAEK